MQYLLYKVHHKKCDDYYIINEVDDEEKYTFKNEEPNKPYEILKVKLNNKSLLERYRYKVWPDYGVPQDLGQFHEFVVDVSERHNSVSEEKGILIHCSAGVGRTGVFLMSFLLYNHLYNKNIIDSTKILDSIIESINDNNNSDLINNVANLLSSLRNDRPHLVQTVGQFEFIIKYFHKIVKEYKPQPAAGGSKKTKKSTKKQRKHKKKTKKH